MRQAAKAAVEWTCAGNPVAVLTPESPVGDPSWSLDGFGVRVGDGTPVGLAEGVGRWLLDGREAEVVGPGTDLRAYSGVLVMGDGSAARTEKAPGHLHPAAVGFDEAVLSALREGRPEALAGLDADLAAEVGAAGAPAWTTLGRCVAAVDDASVDIAVDPFGVLYVVARWTVRWADPA